ncbi:MAG: hypothetical protein HN357_08955 [Chloroflexi bacterium]|nr:hypothetical protein [Chloroflexota bacterium]
MAPFTTNMMDLILRVISVSMGISAVALLAMKMITVENAVILLGIGIVAISLERLSEKQ